VSLRLLYVIGVIGDPLSGGLRDGLLECEVAERFSIDKGVKWCIMSRLSARARYRKSGEQIFPSNFGLQAHVMHIYHMHALGNHKMSGAAVSGSTFGGFSELVLGTSRPTLILLPPLLPFHPNLTTAQPAHDTTSTATDQHVCLPAKE